MNRIKHLVNLIPSDTNTLLDIGADHGYLGIFALKNKKVKSVWNIEISKNALKNGENNFISAGLRDLSRFILSDGFESVSDVPNNSTAVCSGMGVNTIIKILNNNLPNNINTIICMPHNHPIKLREWSIQNNWKIVEETYCEYREIIYISLKLIRLVKNTKQEIDKSELFFGKKEFIDANLHLSKKYWEILKKKILKKPKDKRFISEEDFLNLWEECFESNKLIT